MTLLNRLKHHLPTEVLARLLREARSNKRGSNILNAEDMCRGLVLHALSAGPRPFRSPVPLRIVQFWDRSRIPDDVKHCMATWRSQVAFEYEVFDESSARDFIAREFDQQHRDAFAYCHHPAMKSDYFRLAYLFVRGGTYVDADESCRVSDIRSLLISSKSLGVRPLCRDLASPGRSMALWRVTDEDYRNPNMRFYFNNDVLVSTPRHKIIGRALTRALRLIRRAKKRNESPPIHWTTGPDNLTLAAYDAGLDALRDETELDLSVITNWNEYATHEGGLAYRKTYRDWRTAG